MPNTAQSSIVHIKTMTPRLLYLLSCAGGGSPLATSGAKLCTPNYLFRKVLVSMAVIISACSLLVQKKRLGFGLGLTVLT